MSTSLAVLSMAAIGLGIWAVVISSRLAAAQAKIREAEGVALKILKKRYALLMPAIGVVRNHTGHKESDALGEVLLAGRKADAAGPAVVQSGEEVGFDMAAFKLVAVANKYSDLEHNEEFLAFQAELDQSHAKLTAARSSHAAATKLMDEVATGFLGRLIARLAFKWEGADS